MGGGARDRKGATNAVSPAAKAVAYLALLAGMAMLAHVLFGIP